MAACPRTGSTGCGPRLRDGDAAVAREDQRTRRAAHDAGGVPRSRIDYGSDRWQTVVIIELDDQGLIARETRYYPQQIEAPAWRAALVEAMG